MKSNVTLPAMVFVLAMLTAMAAVGQTNGDFRSKSSGKWSAKQTWEVYADGAWSDASKSPSNNPTSSVTISNGHTVELNQQNVLINNLEVDYSAHLLVNSTSNPNNLNVHGDVTCNGTIGNGSTPDMLVLSVEGSNTLISGDGECRIYSITKSSGAAVSTLTIAMDLELYASTGSSIYNSRNNTLLEIVINSGVNVTTHTMIDLNNGNSEKRCSLLVRSDETGYGSLITPSIDDSDATNTVIERFIDEDRWHYICPPVDDPYATTFLNIYLISWEEFSGTWSYVVDPNTVLEPDMEGYGVWTSSSLLGPTTLEFKGSMNAGSRNIDLTNTTSAAHGHKGYNFAGNPYTSAIDWDYTGANGWTKTHVDNAIYLWNAATSSYSAYVDGVGQNGGSNIIPAHTGFFVHCNQETGVLGVDHGAQVHDAMAQYKAGKVNENDVLSLTVTGAGGSDETILRFKDTATEMYDGQMDALKMFGSAQVPQLYSITAADENLAINSMEGWEHVRVVKLGFSADNGGLYTLAWDGFDTYGSKFVMMLEDLVTGEKMNMQEGDVYSFDHDPSNFSHRFNIRFLEPKSQIGSVTVLAKATGGEKSVNVELEESMPARISIFNLLGQRLVFDQTSLQYSTYRLDEPGYYMVYIQTAQGLEALKVYVR